MTTSFTLSSYTSSNSGSTVLTSLTSLHFAFHLVVGFFVQKRNKPLQGSLPGSIPQKRSYSQNRFCTYDQNIVEALVVKHFSSAIAAGTQLLLLLAAQCQAPMMELENEIKSLRNTFQEVLQNTSELEENMFVLIKKDE